MAIELENIGGQVCEPVGGMSKLYYALHSDFEQINDPKKICDEVLANASTDFSGLAEISTAHVFKAGKYFREIECITESISLESKQIGEASRSLFSNELKLEIADSNAKVLGAARFLKNQKLIILVEEFGSGRIRQIGSKRFPAMVKDLTSVIEATAEGKNTLSGVFYDKQLGPAPIYKGEIKLTAD